MSFKRFSIRNNRQFYFYILCAICAIVSIAASSWATDSSTGKLSVYVVNYPLKYFAERIGGEHVKVVFPAPATVDPAYWMPEIKTISAYQQADLILLNGAGYAKWIYQVSLPQSKLVNTSAKFEEQYIRVKGAVSHSHGPGGQHAHEGVAFTTWIDFNLAAGQAKAIAVAFGRRRPQLKNTFEKKFADLKKDLLALDQSIKAIVSKNRNQPLIASHPVYDYFARRYGLNINSVHWEPDEIPSREQWMELQNMLKHHPTQWMIWEGTPLKEPVERLKSLGINSLVYDPCGNTPQEGDFLKIMHQNVENLQRAFP